MLQDLVTDVLEYGCVDSTSCGTFESGRYHALRAWLADTTEL